MKEQFVSYEIALKLKELGFNGKCFGWYDLKQEDYTPCVRYDFYTMESFDVLAPLYQQVIDWLIKEYNCIIEVGIHSAYNSDQEALLITKENKYFWWVKINYYGKDFEISLTEDEDFLLTDIVSYKEALEIGISESLNLIKNGN